MENTGSKRHVHPVILARAKELRRPLTPHENKLWQRLRTKQLCDLKFRRQHLLDRFILDFFCAEHRLVIEIDGSGHAQPDQHAYDQARTEWLEQRGLRVIRFSNTQVDTNLTGVRPRLLKRVAVSKRWRQTKIITRSANKAMLMLNAGLPVLTLQQILGQQRVETTLRYARLYDETVARNYGRAMAGIEALKH